MTGYQQAILYLNGSVQDNTPSHGPLRFIVRSVDKFYIDAVADLFAANIYCQHCNAPGKRDYWCIKDAFVAKPALADVSDWHGFCRAFVELQGSLALWKHRNRRGEYISIPRLRIYGAEGDLLAIAPHLPAAPKKMQYVRTQTGSTCMLAYQSPAEVLAILDFLDGSPRNDAVWAKWSTALNLPL